MLQALLLRVRGLRFLACFFPLAVRDGGLENIFYQTGVSLRLALDGANVIQRALPQRLVQLQQSVLQ